MSRPPEIVVRHLAGTPGGPVLVVGPSLGTRVDRLWGAVAAELDPLHVVGWDLPGHGASPAAREGFDLRDLAGAVLAAVDRAVGGTGQYLYAGDSVGGAVGLQLLLDHPGRFRAAAIVCSSARFGSPDAWTDRADLVRREGMAPMVASSPDRWFGRRVRTRRHGPGQAAAQAAVEDLAGVDAESYALVCEALARFDLTARLGEIATPLLAIAGADDLVTPAAAHQQLTRAVRAGRFAVLRGVGHLAPLEDPRRTAALLREHFAPPAGPREAARQAGHREVEARRGRVGVPAASRPGAGSVADRLGHRRDRRGAPAAAVLDQDQRHRGQPRPGQADQTPG